MRAVEVKPDIYWVGAIDWSSRNFHGYTTDRGATYNAYLIIDEKVTLIDTVKAPFKEELLERVRSVIDPAEIDYLVSNHVEMDHSGAIPFVIESCPNARIVTSSPAGMKGLTAHFGELDYLPVKANDSLNIGRRTLQFVPTPMVHWPDNMVTYCPEEKLLFSNDAFGQHYASTGRFDEEEPLSIVMEEAKKYYANIVMPYSKQAAGAVKVCEELAIDMICSSHGVIWKKHIPAIMEAYQKWTSGQVEEKALVVFDSMWHSTEIIAHTIVEAFSEKGIPAKMLDLKINHNSDIMTQLLDSQYIAVGSPTLNNQMMPTVASFLCYLKGLSPKNRQAFAFGSYGWGGQSIGLIEEELKACGFDICLEKIRIPYIPDKKQLEKIREDILNL